MEQQRTYAHQLVTFANNTAYSDPPIDMRQFSALQVHMPAAWTAAALGFSVGPMKDSTYGPLYVVPTCSTKLTVLCQVGSVTASQVYHCPAEVGGAGWVRLWSQNGSGTNVAQGAARVVRITKKS